MAWSLLVAPLITVNNFIVRLLAHSYLLMGLVNNFINIAYEIVAIQYGLSRGRVNNFIVLLQTPDLHRKNRTDRFAISG